MNDNNNPEDRKAMLKAGWMLGAVLGDNPLLGLAIGALPYLFPKAADRLIDKADAMLAPKPMKKPE
jgi:O-methyltransferase involved in polyketide biosynthesis